MESAAFFDLDRTLLIGASGPMFSTMLAPGRRAPGPRRSPAKALVFKIFDVIGETLPSMLVARQMARAASGWDRSWSRKPGELAAERLVDEVPGFARALIAQHHAEGRRVVMATTSPFDLVEPLAEALGVDDVIATRYGEAEGRYDGSVDGLFVWGPGKLDAVREWALSHGVDIGKSYAYSDSVYDLPLLSAVGFPTAINPDPRLRLVAALRRWPTQFFDVPAGVPKFAGIEPQQVLQALARPELFPWVRFDIAGIENIPAEGPAIIVGNHRSYFDPLAIGMVMARPAARSASSARRRCSTPRWWARSPRPSEPSGSNGAPGSDEPLAAAAEALAAGEVVALMPEGTIPRGRAFFDPVLKGRWGAARLAAQTRAPVIPIGLWGTEKVWPRNARTPNVLAIGHPPTVRARVGPPIDLKYRSADADTKRIMAALVDQLPDEARVDREPTPEELARILPAGYEGDPEAEITRRPGQD